ncbi:hypothetical protein LO772_07860 [Yinghuangia sp. ASG 101]|uniref:hypothetical protein n=1 Tax=Yinghuangia sp. ASG 101 TaxID=2896848 RepID=UPI001E2A8A41|nr:hypothetical protein [Yinghuangia sp. ASG 101]UGQ13511.1 hypothetical protein LO772_07860 [Yinghuangia sp. ASG 101]
MHHPRQRQRDYLDGHLTEENDAIMAFGIKRGARRTEAGRPAAGQAKAASPFASRGFVVSVGFLGFCSLFGLITLFSGSGLPRAVQGSATTAPQDAATDSPGIGEAVPPEPTWSAAPMPSALRPVCPQQGAADTSVPVQAPIGVRWSGYRGIWVPSSPTAGPAVMADDLAYCYAHTPTGALLAIAQIGARYAVTPQWRLLMAHQVVADDARERAYALRDENEADNGPLAQNTALTRGALQVVGFRFISHTEDEAVVQLLRGDAGSGRYVSAVHTVRWQDGDWRLQVQENSSAASVTQKETSTAGYIPWSPNVGR